MKVRLDTLLVENNLAPTEDKARRMIMAGLVRVDGQIEDKAGSRFKPEQEVTLKQKQCRYVGRGGLKLEKAIGSFALDLNNKICMDIGASTGGFTDCMLINGARKVYAVDVGYGLLDYRLRIDPRVVNLEKTNMRYLDIGLIKEPVDFISIDVSFISLRLMFPVVRKIIEADGNVVCLIKPQFEARREQVGDKGIVRDKNVHLEVIDKVIKYAEANDFHPADLTYSPVTGAKGNIEYLLNLSNQVEDGKYEEPSEVVFNAHRDLDK